jgi:hypothetical protein
MRHSLIQHHLYWGKYLAHLEVLISGWDWLLQLVAICHLVPQSRKQPTTSVLAAENLDVLRNYCWVPSWISCESLVTKLRHHVHYLPPHDTPQLNGSEWTVDSNAKDFCRKGQEEHLDLQPNKEWVSIFTSLLASIRLGMLHLHRAF